MDNAFVISAFRRDKGESKSVVAVLFAPDPPTAKTLKSMGFINIQSSEQVKVSADGPSEPTLFFFEKGPCVKEVMVARVKPDYTLGEIMPKQGDPCAIIPCICGSAAERFLNPKRSLGISDFPKALPERTERRTIPPSDKVSRNRQ